MSSSRVCEVNEGDEVLVHGAPDAHRARREADDGRRGPPCTQASWPRRLSARVLGTSGITELYEVGFEG
ncbi:MAG: hypothetical protein U5K74_10085 [Gemmatimonadaceae bacterium]|nr:hypothetical protein [Gemmatimonadaceae bacterium]